MAGGGETHRMHEKLSARTRKSIDEIAAEASAKHAAAATARSAMAAAELTRREKTRQHADEASVQTKPALAPSTLPRQPAPQSRMGDQL